MLNYDPTAGEAPPQAPAPVNTLADLATVTAPTPTEDLRTAAFGDQGAEQYARLAAAGQRPTSPGLAGIAGMPAAPAAAPSTSTPQPSDLMQLLGDVAMGAAGKSDDVAARGVREQQLQIQQQNARQSQASSDFDFLAKLKNMPVQYRPGLIANYFNQQGRQIPPDMAAMIGDQQILARMTSPEIGDRVKTDPAFAQMYWFSMDKPEAFASLNDTISQSHAQAEKAISEAQKAAAEAGATPGKVDADKEKAALDIAFKSRQVGRVSTGDIEALNALGYTMQESPVPGSPAAKQFTPVKKSEARPGAPDAYANLQKNKAATTAATTRARTAESPIPATVTDKLANFDNALDIINQLNALYAKGSPTDQARKSWLNRVQQEFRYQWGFDMPDNLDEDTALRSLGAITAGRAFIQGRPNQELMNEIWKHTGHNALVSPDQMRDRLKIMEHAVRRQRSSMIHYARSGRGSIDDLEEHEKAATGEPANTPTTPEAPAPDINSILKQYGY